MALSDMGSDPVNADESFQKKMKDTADNYTGEQTPEAAFQNVVLPMAEEAGCHFTWEDYQNYLQEEAKNLNLDEMDQVAGGAAVSLGAGYTNCDGLGWGAGGAFGDNSGICIIVGYGGGLDLCAAVGFGPYKNLR